MPTVAESVTGAPSTVPSFGVTVTLTLCPLLPLPASDRSNVSVSDVVVVVCRVEPSTFQRYVSVTVSPSRSVFVAVAVSVAFVLGVWSLSATVALGAVFRMVTGDEVSGTEVSEASETVTRTRIRSPLSPFPAVARFRVGVVAPAISIPFFVHW